MGASKLAYIPKTATLQGLDLSLQPVTVDVFVAKFLYHVPPISGYFNQSDSDSVKRSNILALFYLDEIQAIKTFDGTNYRVGFVGMVIVGGTNAAFHKSTRFSGCRPKNTSSNFEYLNDAGLNTLGNIIPGAWPNVIADLLNNSIKLTSIIKSAFYTANNKWGVKMKCIGIQDHPENPANYTESVFTTVHEKTIGLNTTLTLTEYPVNVGDYYLVAPNRYEVRHYITNDEGTTERDMWTVTMNLYGRSCTFGSTLIEASTPGYIANTRYFNAVTLIWKDAITGNPADATTPMTYLFTDLAGSNVAPDGFYMFAEIYNNHRGYVQVSGGNGGIVGWDEPTPDHPDGGFDLGSLRLEIPYYGYGNTIVVAYADAESNGFVTPKGFMYEENIDGVVTMFAGQVPSTTRKGAGYYILSEGYGEFPYETCGWVRLSSSGVVIDSSEN